MAAAPPAVGGIAGGNGGNAYPCPPGNTAVLCILARNCTGLRCTDQRRAYANFPGMASVAPTRVRRPKILRAAPVLLRTATRASEAEEVDEEEEEEEEEEPAALAAGLEEEEEAFAAG